MIIMIITIMITIIMIITIMITIIMIIKYRTLSVINSATAMIAKPIRMITLIYCKHRISQ